MTNTSLPLRLSVALTMSLVGCASDDLPAETTGSTSGSNGSTGSAPGTTDSTPGSTGIDTSEDSGTSGTDSGGQDSTGTADECALEDEPVCIDGMNFVQCQEVDGVLVNVEVQCEADSICAVSGCASPIQQEFINQLTLYVDEVESRSAVPVEPDWALLIEDGTRAVVAGDDSPQTLFDAARGIQLRIPQGHQWVRFGPSLCGDTDGMAYSRQTFYGACARASDDGAIVTVAAPDNPLGLTAGDRIVGTSAWTRGATFLQEMAAEPLCSSLTPTSEEAMRRQAAADLFGLLDEGDTVTVVDPSGGERELVAPARLDNDPVGWCLNPIAGGFSTFEAQLTMRPDGVAVIRVPHFGPSETPFPQPLTPESYYEWVSDYVDRLAIVMDGVPPGAPIIWDARGNSGGAAEVPLAIVAGMPGAIRTPVSEGYLRIEGTSPAEFQSEPVPTFMFEVPQDDRLNHNAPTAVLVDGVATSAADFFALGAKEYSDAIVVGTPGTGNYGFGGVSPSVLGGSVAELAHRIDFMQSRRIDGEPLEGFIVVPDIVVEYDPADLAAGVDTVLEAAVAAVLS
ncbi:MAG: hypothetical protein K0V04_33250 [Deltaproteobacteria bacterium]|nr:hypothetical protein [Deltaproteobacteria bacterium]